MAQNHIQEGKKLAWTNDTGADVLSGAAVLVGVMLCVALGNIADGEEGQVATEEVFALPMAAEDISMGAQLYWDDTNSVVTTTSTDNTACGKAAADAASGDETCPVKLNA